ncbi:uncharacterized protein LOC130625673 [Hydractinia symbiolongicarpus]|uniref:uncharacterized protein LOC130625665 n=1 Tax=Hydractinia symbiolongicarpus TaxID=13093 RepID=UPI002550D6E0|nr:uncharacterized protein LOC130625665 [Hydractinia symbiolongicarpus]XP_057296756.1 uncharacterized protein LOC130625673 [Hydractinia symbiolongicarpus]
MTMITRPHFMAQGKTLIIPFLKLIFEMSYVFVHFVACNCSSLYHIADEKLFELYFLENLKMSYIKTRNMIKKCKGKLQLPQEKGEINNQKAGLVESLVSVVENQQDKNKIEVYIFPC